MNAILSIESSCDDTGASIIIDGQIASNVVSSQAIHIKYGGVVPELASRAHQINIIPVVNKALQDAKLTLNQLSAVAVTQGPGLMGSLLVGFSFAKSMAFSLGIPLIGVNHLQGHISALLIDSKPAFPLLCLLVSGGHTQIILMEDELTYSVLGTTQDDAVGEAFDKGAKLLGFDYPGGPLIDKYAQQGNPKAFEFPTPKTNGLNFSFSGLKTSLLYKVQEGQSQDLDFINNHLNDLCASYQNRLVEYLLKIFLIAIKEFKPKSIGLCGGVAANSLLRSKFNQLGIKTKIQSHIPDFQYCTDNAAMIAVTGYYKFLQKDFLVLKATIF